VENTVKAFLNKILDYFEKNIPDLITGWNVNFDMVYLMAYMREHEVSYNRMSPIQRAFITKDGKPVIKGVTILDMLYATKQFLPSDEPSWKLGKFSKRKIGVGKLHYGGNIGELWETEPKQLLKYNVGDAELTLGIDRKYGLLNYYNEVRRQSGCLLTDVVYTNSVMDAYKLRKANERNIVLDRKGAAKKGSFKGAIVLDATPGIHLNVILLDLEKLYPMCMLTLNISPDTVHPEGDLIAPNGVRFRSDVEGFNQSILREFIAQRNQMQEKVKQLRARNDPTGKTGN